MLCILTELACISEVILLRNKWDALGKLGLSSIQKITAAIRLISYGISADWVDEYVRIGESMALKCLTRFSTAECKFFGEEYLRQPNAQDIQRLLQVEDPRGWPDMIGSLDCMH